MPLTTYVWDIALRPFVPEIHHLAESSVMGDQTPVFRVSGLSR